MYYFKRGLGYLYLVENNKVYTLFENSRILHERTSVVNLEPISFRDIEYMKKNIELIKKYLEEKEASLNYILETDPEDLYNIKILRHDIIFQTARLQRLSYYLEHLSKEKPELLC